MTFVSAPGPRVSALRWAARAFGRELLGFRFNYPIETIPAAGPRESLHYYVHSERLFFDAMELDSQGIPFQRSRRIPAVYNPAYVAWYGLVSLGRSLRGQDPAGRQAFFKQVNWLLTHATHREDGSAVWQYSFDWHEGNCFFKAPWISAMAQGLAISALVRAHRATGRKDFLDVASAATRVFEKNVEDGGVRTLEDGRVLYEEYPGYPLARVLDGFLFSLLGLYDLSVETGDPRLSQLFADGIEGLKHTIAFWNYRGKWSWYGSHGYLCPPHYHRLNCALLPALARLSGESILSQYAESWNSARLPLLDKLEVFTVFVLSKNWARVRFRCGTR